MKDLKNMSIQQIAEYITKMKQCGYSIEYITRIIKI